MTDQVSNPPDPPPDPPDGPARTTRGRRTRRKSAAAKMPATVLVGQITAGAGGARPAAPRNPNPIVPPRTVARRALLTLVAIMSFLSCLSVAAVAVVVDRAEGWQRQIAEEITIQVKPSDGNMDAIVARAAEIAMQVRGVTAASILDEKQSTALLEPWLGTDFDIAELPIPRLIAVRVADDADLATLARRLQEEVPTASLDDHGEWLQRLSSMAQVMTIVGFVILALVFAATALCVVFATRGAMAGNRIVIEVLHFVGAEDSYVAREFQRHFLLLGLKGASIGGALAMALFLVISLLGRLEGPTPEEAQLRSLFGGVTVGLNGYVGSVIAVLTLAVIIAVTARMTVRRTLRELD